MSTTLDHLYSTARWFAVRKQQLSARPLCAECMKDGRVSSANVVDHITPHRGDVELFWNVDNLQSLCYSCHSNYKQTIERRGYDPRVGNDGWPIDPQHPVNATQKKK